MVLGNLFFLGPLLCLLGLHFSLVGFILMVWCQQIMVWPVVNNSFSGSLERKILSGFLVETYYLVFIQLNVCYA